MECGRGLEVVINLSKKMIDYMAELSFYHYFWLCSRWNFCNRSRLHENIPQSMMCYFFWDTVYIKYKQFRPWAKLLYGSNYCSELRLYFNINNSLNYVCISK